MTFQQITNANGKVNWSCLTSKCPTPCCGPFDSVAPNLLSMRGVKGDAIPLTEKDLAVLSGMVDPRGVIGNNGSCFMNLEQDGSCPFFRDKLCSIYEIRPLLCRAYPFSFDLAKGFCLDLNCPGVGKGWTDLKIVQEYHEALIDLFNFHFKQSRAALKTAGALDGSRG